MYSAALQVLFNFLFIFTTNSSGNDREKKEALFFWASFLGSNSNQFMISSRFGCSYLNQLNRHDNNNQVNLLFATSSELDDFTDKISFTFYRLYGNKYLTLLNQLKMCLF